jgi:dynein heavy chain
MLAEVQYGGRVTDDFDKILLWTFTLVWFNSDLFNEDFQFFKGYDVLRFKQKEGYINAIENFPVKDPPQVYGLHPNANITYDNVPQN